nr:hypothetical protein [Clostridia bacterium]
MLYKGQVHGAALFEFLDGENMAGGIGWLVAKGMSGGSDCYLVRQKGGALIKFCYDEQHGIYWQEFEGGRWSDKKTVYNNAYGYFCVLVDERQRIYIFCQDICGCLVLCTWQREQPEAKLLFNVNRNVIMPVHIRAFLCGGNIHLFYNMIDQYGNAEVLVQQISPDGLKWGSPYIVTGFDRCNDVPYRIVQDGKSRLYVLKTSFAKWEYPEEVHFEDQAAYGYQLSFRTHYAVDNSWSREEVIHRCPYSYKDYTLLVKDNVVHYLFIVQEEQTDKVIYKNKHLGLGDETVLFTDENIDSCLLMICGEKLWALWTRNGEIYGCFSRDGGKSFSDPRLYERCAGCMPEKVYFQGCFEEGDDGSIGHGLHANELYVLNADGRECFFMDGELKSLSSLDAEGESSGGSVGDSHYDVKRLWELLADICLVIKAADEDKVRLQAQLEDMKGQLAKLNDIVQAIKSQFQTAMEKLDFYEKENIKLKKRCNYLEQRILAYEDAKKLLEKRLAQQCDANKNLKQEPDLVKGQMTSSALARSGVSKNGVTMGRGEDNTCGEGNKAAFWNNGNRRGFSFLKLLSKWM